MNDLDSKLVPVIDGRLSKTRGRERERGERERETSGIVSRWKCNRKEGESAWSGSSSYQ
ncbi:hypothetical protein BgiMline_000395, partial [Biomphalaria glabrata]